MSYTPGPWEVHGDCTKQTFYVHGANAICDIRRGAGSKHGDSRFSRSPAEDEANARLIAAAPDLLEALEDLLLECGLACQMGGWNGTTTIRSMERSRAAIAKARGQCT